MTNQYITIEPSSFGQINEPNPTQTVAGKDISNLLIGEAFQKTLIEQLTQQIAEVLKKDFNKDHSKEANQKAQKQMRAEIDPKPVVPARRRKQDRSFCLNQKSIFDSIDSIDSKSIFELQNKR